MKIQGENFKQIDGFSNYLIGDKGNVYSLRFNKLRSLSLRSGYKWVNLKKNGVQYGFSIHRLVARHFIENKFNKSDVNHINGIKTDNRIDNLEWCTKSENMIHSCRVLGNGIVEKAVLQFDLNGNLLARYSSPIAASRVLNFDKSGISKCCRGIGNTYKNFKWVYEKA